MKQNNKKIIATVVAVIALVAVLFFFGQANKSDVAGELNVQLVNLEGEVVSDKEVEFKEEQTIVEVLEENYDNVVMKDGMLMSIEDFTTPTDWSTFIAILVDGEMSPVGLLEIDYQNIDLLTFQMTEMSYE